MKKLEKINLNKKESINLNDFEMRNLKGGTDMTMQWNSEFNCYMLPEITVIAEKYTKGEITMDEFESILTVALASGGIGFQYGGPYGGLAAFIAGGLGATWAAYYY